MDQFDQVLFYLFIYFSSFLKIVVQVQLSAFFPTTSPHVLFYLEGTVLLIEHHAYSKHSINCGWVKNKVNGAIFQSIRTWHNVQ